MPRYLYKCKKCKREFEVEQRITEEPLTKCTLLNEDGSKCDGEVFRKISKNVGLVFNGSGFYLTDYVHKKENFTNSKLSKPAAKKDETKTESKSGSVKEKKAAAV